MAGRRLEKVPLKSMLADTEVMEDVRSWLAAGDAPESMPAVGATAEGGLEALTEGRVADGVDALEAIVQLKGRPALLIQNGAFADPDIAALRKRLAPCRPVLEKAIQSVGRVELANHPSHDFVGTAWVIGPGLMITNRHVASVFARKVGQRFLLRSSPLGATLIPRVDFKEEHGSTVVAEVSIAEVAHIEPDGSQHPDMAILRMQVDGEFPAAIRIADAQPEFGEDVAAIGYPAYDSRNDAFVMQRIFDGKYNVKRLAPGRISGVHPDGALMMHDCTTLGGNSGSVLIRIETGEAVGLHFAGSYLENNYAVPAGLLKKRLQRFLSTTSVPVGPPPVGREPEAVASALDDRKGYEPRFLGAEIPLPTASRRLAGSVATFGGGSQSELKYTHYSVVMHRDRRLALFTACNIDGLKSWRPRRTRDRWTHDPRLPESAQIDHEFYRGTNFHRGHLVRRLDPAWGDSHAAAAKAVEDSFFWTNCTPQHEGFNPRSWLDLEDYILDNTDDRDLRVSVFTGPVLRENDLEFRGVKIPKEYWKVVAYRNDTEGDVRATGYVVSQDRFLDDMEFVFGAFQTFQVPIATIEDITGLDFGDLRSRDPLARVESPGPRLIEAPHDLLL